MASPHVRGAVKERRDADQVIVSNERDAARGRRRCGSTTPRWRTRSRCRPRRSPRPPGRARPPRRTPPATSSSGGAAPSWCRTRWPRRARCTPSPASWPEARLLVEAMLAEHRAITGLVDELAAAADPVGAAALARALQALFEVHLAKENDQVLPLLVAAPDVSLAGLLGGMHELLGAASPPRRRRARGQRGGGHGCGCREVDRPRLSRSWTPARSRTRSVTRRSSGRSGGLRPGTGLVLVAPHDPRRPAGPARAPRARRVRGRLPRARARGLAAGAGPDDGFRPEMRSGNVGDVRHGGRGAAVGEPRAVTEVEARRGERDPVAGAHARHGDGRLRGELLGVGTGEPARARSSASRAPRPAQRVRRRADGRRSRHRGLARADRGRRADRQVRRPGDVPARLGRDDRPGAVHRPSSRLRSYAAAPGRRLLPRHRRHRLRRRRAVRERLVPARSGAASPSASSGPAWAAPRSAR